MNAWVEPPRGIVVHRRDNRIRIIRKWFDFWIAIFAIWLVFWDIALVFLMSPWLRDISLSPQGSFWIDPVPFVFSLLPDLFMALVPLLFISITGLLNYYAFAGFLNETVVDIDANVISVIHRPLPFWGNKRVSLNVVERVYVTRFRSRGHVTYNVRLKIKGKRSVKLLSYLRAYKQAKFIEKQIAEVLG